MPDTKNTLDSKVDKDTSLSHEMDEDRGRSLSRRSFGQSPGLAGDNTQALFPPVAMPNGDPPSLILWGLEERESDQISDQ